MADKYEHHTEINYINTRHHDEVKQRIASAIEKPSYDNTLLIIDESEQLLAKELDKILYIRKKHDNLKLIISSRKYLVWCWDRCWG